MAEHEKIPAQGGEMPPVERAADTGGRGINTVRGATSAGNAAQDRNTNAAALTDDFRGNDANLVRSIEALIALNDEGALVPHGIGGLARVLLSAAAVRLTSPRAAVPAPEGWKLVPIERSYDMRVKALLAFNTTEKETNDRDDALDAAHRAMLDAAPAAAVAEPMVGHGIDGIPRAAFGPHTNADRIDHCGSCGAENEPQKDDVCPVCHAECSLVSTWGEFQHMRYRNGQRYANNGPQPWEDGPQGVEPVADQFAGQHNMIAAQAVAADGAAQDDIEGIARAAGCTNVDLIGDRAKAIERLTAFAVRVRAAVSPATADERAAHLDLLQDVLDAKEVMLKAGCAQAAFAEMFAAYSARASQAAAPAEAREQFQARVQPWMMECFGPTIAADRIERNHRFLEEALELVQSLGCTASEAHLLVNYTFGRPVGEPSQEVGGVMVTLAALCLANTLDMHAAGETELARISEPAAVLKIRAKQAAKPKHSPLPQAVAARAPYEWRDTGPLETNEGGAA
ncbi:hypothetical protein ACNSZH_26590 [Burkholderia gladioli]|uniref:hypothetical protein n=1 Tax=Burkholderia gladioli TaxID=28095 RepID=UPI003B9839BD